MVTARVTEVSVKVLLVVVLLVYLSFYYGVDKHNLTNIKSHLKNGSACGIVVGGSNAMNGISARDLSFDDCSFVNLAVGIEGGRSFDRYLDWVFEIQNNAKVVIYSPAYFWSTSNNKINDFDGSAWWVLRNKSMASYLSELTGSAGRSSIELNSNGDVINYSCDSQFSPFKIPPEQFASYDLIVAEKLLSRMVDLKKRLKADYVFLKVPPLYVENGSVTEVESLANHRLGLIRSRAGEVVINDNFVFSHPKYFCNSTHSNEKGRRVFTENIKKSIAFYLSMKP
jgi:hypothetical protein